MTATRAAPRPHLSSSSARPQRWPRLLALGLLAPGLLALGPACVRDPDCGICDPDALVLESVAGVNYAGRLVKLLGPTCEGPECPEALTEGTYFVEKIVPCVDTPEAAKAPRGVDEWCKVSPLVVDSGLQFIFNNLLDPTSVELVRKKADNPQAMEVFDWKTHIVHLEGPISRFNGDYRKAAASADPDTITRATNLACIENLRKQGRAYDHAVLLAEPDICDGTYAAEDGRVWPLRALLERDGGGPAKIETWRGETDARQAGQSCSPPKDGVDTCCDVCDLELAVNVAKYGVRAPVSELERPGDLRRDLADAIACDPAGDELRQCRDFLTHVYSGDEVRSHEYMWDGEHRRFRVPLADKLRETHPGDRPEGVEQRTVPCEDDADCTAESGAQLAGMACVGHLADDDGAACSAGDDCVERRCVAEWFVGCRADADTTGSQGYCVDTRWVGKGAAACFVAGAPFYVCEDAASCADENFADGKRTQGAGSRLSYADADGDGELAAVEGCRASLGAQDGAACDPLYQPGVAAVDRYDRKQTLPSHTRACVCEDEPAEGCAEFVDELCREGGEAGRPIAAARRGQYALKFVSRAGGVIYDPAIKGVLFLPADLGGVPRSMVETCAAQRGDIGDLSVKDGWRANDIAPELFEDFDRAMCSSATYRVVFNSEPGPGEAPLEYIRDKVGNTLRGKTTYTLHTPDFHVVPGSGFPTDNLRIGACGGFELRFSNKYDMSAENLRKLEIREITEDGKRELGTVAGGPGCSEDPLEGRPCLIVDVKDQDRGAVEVSIDTRRFGSGHLQAGHRYRLAVPGLELAPGETVHDVIAAGGDRYRAAFWDACGMPLVTAMPRLDPAGVLDPDGATRDPDSRYDFTIDLPKPKEDADQDGVQRTCDNAEKVYNPDQDDMDADGFGDVIDLCPTIANDSNSADSDKDGVGNDCDRCSRQATTYNQNYDDSDARFNMRVRNIPHQGDLDQDGIGDACDNCVVRPNCGGFGPVQDGLQPAGVGDPVPLSDKGKCQADVDALPFMGDACAPDGVPLELPGAAGPVGFGDDDDFDQDGLRNFDDVCPRQPLLPPVTCVDAADCPAGAACSAGVCNHVDHDNDGHGDICDNCPDVGNFGQTLDGALQTDDPDGDFVGSACETATGCNIVAEPRRIAFYSEHSQGQCCVRLFDEAAGILDPGAARVDEDGACEVIDPALPLRVDCPEDQEDVTCRALPPRVRKSPGVVDLPFGCEAPGTPMTLDSPGVDGDPDKLYKFMCLMPLADQDFDGVGDGCDLCPYAFDPDNSQYKDSNNKLWPGSGMFCRGAYDPDKGLRSCEDIDEPDTDTDGSTGGTGSTGGA